MNQGAFDKAEWRERGGPHPRGGRLKDRIARIGASYAFSGGGAGDTPAPPGDPPGGMAVLSGCEKTVPFCSMPLPVPSGGSPGGTGGSPVLPTLNTYRASALPFERALRNERRQRIL